MVKGAASSVSVRAEVAARTRFETWLVERANAERATIRSVYTPGAMHMPGALALHEEPSRRGVRASSLHLSTSRLHFLDNLAADLDGSLMTRCLFPGQWTNRLAGRVAARLTLRVSVVDQPSAQILRRPEPNGACDR